MAKYPALESVKAMEQQKRKYESPRQIARQSNILSAAREMLNQGGYEGLTMRGLARRAGVAQGTLYNLFKSKDDLIMAAVDDLLIELGKETYRREPEPGIEAILMHCVVTGEQILRTPAYASAMTRIIMGSPEDSSLIRYVFGRAYPVMHDNLLAAQGAGELIDGVDIEAVSKHLTGNGWAVILLWIMGMMPIDAMVVERERSALLVLVSITQGARKQALEQRLNQIG